MGTLSESVIEYTKLYSSQYSQELPKADLGNYVEAVRQQRGRLANRDYHKWDSSIQGYLRPNKSLDELTSYLYTNTYIYCGVKKIDTPIYQTYRESEFYSEFVNKEADFNSDYSTWKYIYIPLEYPLKNNYLPSLLTWNTDKQKLGYEAPNFYYLESLSAESWPSFYTLVTESLGHPYLGSSFVFSGHIVEQGDGSLLYEYTEIENNYGCIGETYMSPLRPSYLDFPFGIPQPGGLVREDCSLDLIGSYPSYGVFPYLGRFTGYATTDLYNRMRKLYLYEREDKSTFLYEAPPSLYSRSLIENFIDQAAIYLSTNESKQSISIRQKSNSPATIQLSVRATWRLE